MWFYFLRPHLCLCACAVFVGWHTLLFFSVSTILKGFCEKVKHCFVYLAYSLDRAFFKAVFRAEDEVCILHVIPVRINLLLRDERRVFIRPEVVIKVWHLSTIASCTCAARPSHGDCYDTTQCKHDAISRARLSAAQRGPPHSDSDHFVWNQYKLEQSGFKESTDSNREAKL